MSDTYIPMALRHEVRERAGNCCEYCRTAETSRSVDFVIDHVIAEKHGGQTTSENLGLSCYWCNSYKGSDISSIDWSAGEEIVPLFNPRKQQWSDHFALDGVQIRGLTATGRVTIFLLRLDADERFEERELLLTLGEYPC